MIKRTIEISREPAHLRVRLDQLVIQHRHGEDKRETSVPCEDIGMILIDQPQTTYTHGALMTLMRSGAVLVVCGQDHLPAGLLLPMAGHTEVVWRVNDQITVSKPLCKQLWQQLVQAKLRAQAANLAPGTSERSKLLGLARRVRSGDPSNIEAQAARVYWSVWLGEGDPFRRNPDGKDPLNSMLNYGYAVLRAALARSLVAAGLMPVLGLHHSNRSNAFCLADDLLEPLRPMVDACVRELHRQAHNQLDQPTKARLLELLTLKVRVGQHAGPLLVALHRMVASLVRCLEGEEKRIQIPVAEDDAEGCE